MSAFSKIITLIKVGDSIPKKRSTLIVKNIDGNSIQIASGEDVKNQKKIFANEFGRIYNVLQQRVSLE